MFYQVLEEMISNYGILPSKKSIQFILALNENNENLNEEGKSLVVFLKSRAKKLEKANLELDAEENPEKLAKLEKRKQKNLKDRERQKRKNTTKSNAKTTNE